MDKHLVDSSVLVDFSLGRGEAAEFFESMSESAILVHPAAEAEVLVGARDRDELELLRELLGRFRRVRVTTDDFDHCLAFVRRLTLSHGVGWPDCLIAATALRLSVPVVTINDKHFRAIRGLRVVRPY